MTNPARANTLADLAEQDKQPDYRRDMILSASQLSGAESCRRKWWFKSVKKMPQLRRVPDPRTFGDVLHRVLDRFYSMDELGRGHDGKPVDLYPEGWHRVKSKFGLDKGEWRQIGTGDQALIKALVKKAREEGKIHKPPESRCEFPFARELLKDDGTRYSPRMWVVGSIDMVHEAGVEDHKSSKAKKWLLSRNKLKVDYQMNVYGNELLFVYEDQGKEPPASILLCHNGFVKDPDAPLVKKTDIPVSHERLKSFWTSRVLPLAAELHSIKYAGRKQLQQWQEVEGAKENSGACEAYGGCPYQSVCSLREEPEDYKTRITKQNSNSSGCPTLAVVSSSQTHPKTGANNMNFADRLAQLPGRAPTATAPAPTAAAQPMPAAQRPQAQNTAPPPSAAPGMAPQTVAGAPPWHAPGCKACPGTPGFNSNGNACRICNFNSKKAGRKTSDKFEFMAQDGTVYWSDGEEEGSMVLTGEVKTADNTEPPVLPLHQDPPLPSLLPNGMPAPKPTEVTVAPGTVTTSTSSQGAITTDKPTAAEANSPAEETPKPRGPGRPPGAPNKKGKGKTFTLLIDCAPAGHVPGKMQSVNKLVQELALLAAEAAGVESYYDIDVYVRRDAMSKALQQVEISGTLLGSTNSVQEREALAVLRGRASTIYVGTAR